MKTRKEDKLLSSFDSPLGDDWETESKEVEDEGKDVGLSVEGDLEIGRKGNPVTLVIEDEVNGEILEVNHVESAFLVVEDKRKNSSGWLAVAIGEIKTLGKVLGFLTEATLENLKEMVKKKD